MRDGVAKRLADSIEVALKHGDEVVKIDVHDAPATESRRYTQRSACLECGAPFPQTVPQLFSFNSPHGACPSCNGLGVRPPGALPWRRGSGGRFPTALSQVRRRPAAEREPSGTDQRHGHRAGVGLVPE